MKIVNAITTNMPSISEFFKDKIQIVPTIELTDIECTIFSVSLDLLEKQLKKEGFSNESLNSLIVLFTKNYKFTMVKESDDSAFGIYTNLIIFPVQIWRDENLRVDTISTIMLEELCHHFWHIDNEYTVKEKVTEIVRSVAPEMEIHNVFSEEVYKLKDE